MSPPVSVGGRCGLSAATVTVRAEELIESPSGPVFFVQPKEDVLAVMPYPGPEVASAATRLRLTRTILGA
jgi:hypothetical protein